MSLFTTSRPSRIPVIVASSNERTSKFSGAFVCSIAALLALEDRRLLTTHTTATSNMKPARTIRAGVEGTTSARKVRTTHAAINRDCCLATRIRFLCASSVSSVSLWLKSCFTTETQRAQRTHREEVQNQSSITLRACRCLSRAPNKTIADSDNSLDAVTAFIELLSQSTNVHVERARVAIVTVTPDTIQQLLPCNDAVGASRQRRKQCELLVREFYLHAFTHDANVVEIDEQMIVFISLAHRFICATHDCA